MKNIIIGIILGMLACNAASVLAKPKRLVPIEQAEDKIKAKSKGLSIDTTQSHYGKKWKNLSADEKDAAWDDMQAVLEGYALDAKSKKPKKD